MCVIRCLARATKVAFGMLLIFFKCRLELCYLTEDRPVYQSMKMRRKRSER